MKEMFSSVSPKGQVTIPAEVRQLLGVKPKDKVAFRVDNGQVQLVPARHTLESVSGSIEPATSTVEILRSIEEAKEERAETGAADLRGA
jgi:AbrB family looped-hinge helix DNA binding protein